MKQLKVLSLLFLLIFLASCARVQIYDQGDNKTGIQFYNPKPYLMVVRNPEKDEAVKTSIIYLPDLKNPQRAEIKGWIGSVDLKLELTNGILTSYGEVVDSKIPETITAVSGAIEPLAKLTEEPETEESGNGDSKDQEEISEENKRTPLITFYEIVIDSNGTSFKKVDLNIPESK